MIITNTAQEKIKEIADTEGIGHTSIRVKTIAGGCSGFQFDMEYDNKPGDLDEVLQIDGIQVIIDPISFQYMEEMTIDYKTSALGEGFNFSGGTSTFCGCGNSASFR